MGLSIHYRGTLTDKNQIYPLIDELEDIAKSMQWEYRLFDEDWSQRPDATLEKGEAGTLKIEGDARLKGVILNVHEDCESLSLCFDASGAITSLLNVALNAEEGYPSGPQWLSVKTQFAGPEVHVAVVKLLRYLKSKYLHDLEVNDESGYWETDDYGAVVENIDLINRGIAAITRRLEAARPESTDDIIAQIEKALRDMQDRENREE